MIESWLLDARMKKIWTQSCMMIVLYEHHDSFDMCSVVKGGFGYIFNGSVHYLPINEAYYLLATGISWSVALSCLSIFFVYSL